MRLGAGALGGVAIVTALTLAGDAAQARRIGGDLRDQLGAAPARSPSTSDVANATPPPKARPLGSKPRPAQSNGDRDTMPENAGAAAAMYAPVVRLAYQLATS